MKLLSILLATLALVSCGQPQSNKSALSYKVVDSAHHAGLSLKVHDESRLVCIADQHETNALRLQVISAIRMWTDALKSVATKPLHAGLTFRENDFSNCDVTVRANSTQRSMTFLSTKPEIYLEPGATFAVVLHEFGHAFGMRDVYQPANGRCLPGQPQAVMCSRTLTSLTSDDIYGIQALYQRLGL